jgi:DnaJ-class molecular chaperone
MDIGVLFVLLIVFGFLFIGYKRLRGIRKYGKCVACGGVGTKAISVGGSWGSIPCPRCHGTGTKNL